MAEVYDIHFFVIGKDDHFGVYKQTSMFCEQTLDEAHAMIAEAIRNSAIPNPSNLPRISHCEHGGRLDIDMADRNVHKICVFHLNEDTESCFHHDKPFLNIKVHGLPEAAYIKDGKSYYSTRGHTRWGSFVLKRDQDSRSIVSVPFVFNIINTHEGGWPSLRHLPSHRGHDHSSVASVDKLSHGGIHPLSHGGIHPDTPANIVSFNPGT